MPRAVAVVSRLVCALCVLVLCGFAVFDARAERITAGRTPREFARRLDPGLGLGHGYASAIGVAHNAGDDLGTATEAAAYGANAIETDVRSDGSELFASHDAPLPDLEDVVFRGPSLQQAWEIAQLRGTVLVQLAELRTDPPLRAAIDGVSVRNRLATLPLLAWLEQQRLTTFVWTVNDETRMNELLANGVDGVISDRLDILRLLGR
jgi:glycerophosphoryl diester phosphodiesterase